METVCVKDLMWKDQKLVSPNMTLAEAAKKMMQDNCGVLAVGTGDQVTGVITDRDIIVRAIAIGKNPETERVANYMTDERIHTCKEGDSIRDAAEKMKTNTVCRLMVMDDTNRFSGILSFNHILLSKAKPDEVAGVVMHATRDGEGSGAFSG
jgi:predicted transcriptional regulator